MEVVAFVGPSGTGKSHRAIGVAHNNNCDAIIDDGLLIKGTKILAGTSAKNETNRIQAVKRAIFTEDDHADAVRSALATGGIHRLLILATSDNMIQKIVLRLGLPQPEKTVYIQQIASRQEMKKAKQMRLKDGKRQTHCAGADGGIKAAFYGLLCRFALQSFFQGAQARRA